MALHELRERPRPAGALAAIRRAALPLDAYYRPLIDFVGEARFALIGEASHGTLEFYRERAELTKRLIVEGRFAAVVAEADWPDAYRVNRYVRGLSDDNDADAALSGFKRFPAWMWRNTVVRDFVAWLREYNDSKRAGDKVGFYGMDLYSLTTSIDAVLGYLARVDPEAEKRARYRYSCFDHYGEDTQAYGYAAAFGMSRTCENEVVQQLVEMMRRADPELSRALETRRLQRAIGVIYLPETERVSHYFHAVLPRQFDAMIHIDRTRALQPLDPSAGWTDEEAPETFPTGV